MKPPPAVTRRGRAPRRCRKKADNAVRWQWSRPYQSAGQLNWKPASTSEIARRAGVSHGAVFTVAPTTEKLAAAAFEGEVRSVGEQAFARASAGAGKIVPRVTDIFAALFDFYEQNHQIARVLLIEMMLCAPAAGDKTDDRMLNDYMAGLRLLLQTAVERKQIAAGADVEALTSALLGIYLVFLLARLNAAQPDRATQMVNCRRAIETVLCPPVSA